MPGQLNPSDQEAISKVVADLETAWNAADGDAFAASMTDDADFVTIRAEHYRGRQAIASGHSTIFRTVYSGSRARFTVESARLLREDLALMHVTSALDVPAGPLAGRHGALFSAVLTRETNGWRIASFHNTLAAPR